MDYDYRKKCLQRLNYYRNKSCGVELLDSNFRGMFSPFAVKKSIKRPNNYDIKATYDFYKKIIKECDEKDIVDLHWKFEIYMIRKRTRW